MGSSMKWGERECVGLAQRQFLKSLALHCNATLSKRERHTPTFRWEKWRRGRRFINVPQKEQKLQKLFNCLADGADDADFYKNLKTKKGQLREE